jgi:hypothetical protein
MTLRCVSIIFLSLYALLTGAGELALIGVFAMSPWVIAGWLRMQSAN